jgi:hypothetical protein
MMLKEWTKEWYQVLSAEQLSDILVKAKKSFQNSRRWEQDTARLMWSMRVQNLEEEKSIRESSRPELPA